MNNLKRDKKIKYFKDILDKLFLNIEKNKSFNIIDIGEYNNCIETLKLFMEKINKLKVVHNDEILNLVKVIQTDTINIIKKYGIDKMEDLINICFGNTFTSLNNIDKNKLELYYKYFHPLGYKIVSKKQDVIETKNGTNMIVCEDDFTNNIYSSNDYSKETCFYIKCNGMKLNIYNEKTNKYIIINGILDNIIFKFIDNPFIDFRLKDLKNNLPKIKGYTEISFQNYLTSLTLRDIIVYENNLDLYMNYKKILENNKSLTDKPMSQMIKEFISSDIYQKQQNLINLLIQCDNIDNKYLAYMLYDLLSNDTNDEIDTKEQIEIYNSFPWSIKDKFKESMNDTVNYTRQITNYDLNKIPFEQQICLMKTCDDVKEKAFLKLKEIKLKGEDSGTKARQYLEGLLKIPFGIYKNEKILTIMNTIKHIFKEMCDNYDLYNLYNIEVKNEYTNIEIIYYLHKFNENTINSNELQNIYLKVTNDKKEFLKNSVKILNGISKKHKLKDYTISSKNKKIMKENIDKYFEFSQTNETLKMETIYNFNKFLYHNDFKLINQNIDYIKEYIGDIKNVLDKSVYGHNNAKKQIERIIGQWINGDLDGYCFGFEGPPGVGKTSLAKKGISNCLLDENGKSRPFAMIQMGGDSNGSTLHGHNYTYVGSTWGSIVQILIDKQCMNPIIFIDEVDKISKTEQGKEIIGILTHLLDSTQNDCFQDKYFNGINLDLSKALFILSYNDPKLVDHILLDRIHRVKFDHLSLKDKLIICNDYILPEIYKKMGLTNMIHIGDNVLRFIIDTYTTESGVRKLKEILFEIVGEINIDILKNCCNNYEFPIVIDENIIKHKYLKEKHPIIETKIHNEPQIGFINGMWANSIGRGGITPIQTKWRPGEKYLGLHLTGTQGNVMKESMNVSLTLAFNLTNKERIQEINTLYGTSQNTHGIHIHCPDTGTPKDGPSAGTAITTVLYSLFNNKKIKNTIAITGEICLNGNVTEIGGLDLKILGSIKAGVTEIIYPHGNKKDFDLFMEKHQNSSYLENIVFHDVKHISEVLELVFV
jgi:ATP-dependent Lon protease